MEKCNNCNTFVCICDDLNPQNFHEMWPDDENNFVEPRSEIDKLADEFEARFPGEKFYGAEND